MGVAQPLEQAEKRRIMDGQNLFSNGEYVPVHNFEASKYPKWVYKGNKSKQAVDEIAELHLKKEGWTDTPPKVVVPKED